MGMKPTAAARDLIMNELLWCGGEQKTRAQLERELLAEGFERKYVDFFIFCLSEGQRKARERGQTMNIDPQRKAQLEKAMGKLQDGFDLPTIYSVGLATLIRDWQYDANATGEEVKAILQEHGMSDDVTPAIREQRDPIREFEEMAAQYTPEQRALLAQRVSKAPPDPTFGGSKPKPGRTSTSGGS